MFCSRTLPALDPRYLVMPFQFWRRESGSERWSDESRFGEKLYIPLRTGLKLRFSTVTRFSPVRYSLLGQISSMVTSLGRTLKYSSLARAQFFSESWRTPRLDRITNGALDIVQPL